MSHSANIARIRAINNALGPIRDQVVFVGGATVSLYADRAATEVRPTDDVDILVEIITRWDYAALEDQLRKIGFENVRESHFLGRYRIEGIILEVMEEIILDVMPTDESILGFSNKWYATGFKTAVDYAIDDRLTVKIFSPPYFVASKLEAFKNRGNNDGRTSSDFEDIVYILENRRAIWAEMQQTDEGLRQYLIGEFKVLYNNKYIEEWIDANASYNSPPSSYFIMSDMESFIS